MWDFLTCNDLQMFINIHSAASLCWRSFFYTLQQSAWDTATDLSNLSPLLPMPALSPVFLHASCSAATATLHPHSSWSHIRGEQQPWISPVVPAGAAAALMSCLLCPVRASAHVQPCVPQSGDKMLQIVAPSAELRPQPLISALQNMPLGRGCCGVAWLYPKWKSASLNRFCCFVCSLHYSFRIIYHHFAIASN